MGLGKLGYYALAISSVAGTIIGVGMFGLPFVAAQSGFLLMLLYLVFFGVIVGVGHLLYLEVTLRTKENHRLTGYAGYYLGPRWKTATFLQGIISLWGTLLIYTIVTAKFFFLIFPQLGAILSETEIGLLFFLLCAFIIGKGDKTVGNQELFFTIPMVVLIFIIFGKSVASFGFSGDLFFSLHPNRWIAPYGITLFALYGFAIIPIIEHVLAPGTKKGLTFNYPFIVLFGTLLPAFLYVLFTWGVLAASGIHTTQDALSGLITPLGQGIVAIGALLGIFAIYTSFIAVGNELSQTFYQDYHFKKIGSIVGALGVPFIFYLADVRNFIAIADFVGALMGGYIGVLVILLFWKAKQKGDVTPPFSLTLPKPVGFLMMVIFAFASLYAIATTLSPLLLSAVWH